MTTFNQPIDKITKKIMDATRPVTKAEVEHWLGEVYNAGYDSGWERGVEYGQIEAAEDD